MAPRKKAAPKIEEVPTEQIVAVAVEADEKIRDAAVELVNEAISHCRHVLRTGDPVRRDKIASIFTTQVVKTIVDRGPQGDATVEEYHEIRRRGGLGNLTDG